MPYLKSLSNTHYNLTNSGVCTPVFSNISSVYEQILYGTEYGIGNNNNNNNNNISYSTNSFIKIY